uniref:Uncharacterized protein n=1 Tax=Schizaphis graminum TaxID=13262 RepID=A0A2S2NE98_SCHGA
MLTVQRNRSLDDTNSNNNNFEIYKTYNKIYNIAGIQRARDRLTPVLTAGPHELTYRRRRRLCFSLRRRRARIVFTIIIIIIVIIVIVAYYCFFINIVFTIRFWFVEGRAPSRV